MEGADGPIHKSKEASIPGLAKVGQVRLIIILVLVTMALEESLSIRVVGSYEMIFDVQEGVSWFFPWKNCSGFEAVDLIVE